VCPISERVRTKPRLAEPIDMRKKLTALGLAVVLVAGLGGILLLAVKHEPYFYRSCRVEPGAQRKQLSVECLRKMLTIGARFDGDQGKWSYDFTQEECNSYFEEDFIRLKDAEALAKLGISEPRIRFDDDDRIRVAFRYGSGFWSTVLSYELRIWLAPLDANVICVEILNRQIGGLPFASQTMLNELKELCRNKNLDVNWYRSDNNPVAVIRLPGNRARHFAQLLAINVSSGRLEISGQCNDPGLQAMLTR
jgi:hypothetical protein